MKLFRNPCAIIFLAIAIQLLAILSMYLFGGIDDFIITILPWIPTNGLQWFSAKILWLLTVNLFPFLKEMKLIQFENCFEKQSEELKVLIAASKGGTVFSAFIGWEISKVCGVSIGTGEPMGPEIWPRVADSYRDHDVDMLLSVGYAPTWVEYARNSGKDVQCVSFTRDPMKRFLSVYTYTRDGSEYGLWGYSKHLGRLNTYEERLNYTWNIMGRKVMEDTHEMLVHSISNEKCTQIKFDNVMKGGPAFDEEMKKMLRALKVKQSVYSKLLPVLKKHDMASKTEEQRKSNTHISGHSLELGEKDEVFALMKGNPEIYGVLSKQCKELNYDC